MSSVNTSKVILKFDALPATVHGALLKTMGEIGYSLADYVKTQKLSGEVLKVRTGQLRSSIQNQVSDDGSTIKTTVGVDGNRVPYAAIHEYGGYVKVPEVVGPLMVFTAKDGTTVFTRKHKAFTANMPERSYLRSSLSDNRASYVEDINAAIKGAL